MTSLGKTKIVFILIVTFVIIFSGIQFYQHRHYQMPIVAGPGVTKVGNLSDYCQTLKGTPGDTKVFYLEGKEKGGKILLMAKKLPLKLPYFETASRAYAEQVGEYRQLRPIRGDRVY